MSDEEKEKNAEAEELEVQEQVQDAPAEEKVAEPSLEEELLKWRDTAMRTAAEYDNYRKRMVKEKEECAKFANQRLLEELLPVIDNFEMGMAAASADASSMIYIGKRNDSISKFKFYRIYLQKRNNILRSSYFFC